MKELISALKHLKKYSNSAIVQALHHALLAAQSGLVEGDWRIIVSLYQKNTLFVLSQSVKQ